MKKSIDKKRSFTAVVKKEDGWWIGWLEEIPGVNGQGKTKREFLASLRSALKEALASQDLQGPGHS